MSQKMRSALGLLALAALFGLVGGVVLAMAGGSDAIATLGRSGLVVAALLAGIGLWEIYKSLSSPAGSSDGSS